MADEETQPTEARAVMSSGNSSSWGVGKLVAKVVEQAMSDAVNQALADGVAITDSTEIRRRMMQARQDVLDKVHGAAL